MSKKAKAKTVKKPIDYYNIEEELKKYNYTLLTTLSCDESFAKALNEKGQKVYILIDEPLTINCHLSLSPSSESFADYSSKKNGLKIAELLTYGMMFEHPEGLCYIYNTVEQDAENIVVKESNYLLPEKIETDILAYPVIRLSEIRHDNNLVLNGTDTVTRHLRNDTYTTAFNELSEIQNIIKDLDEDYQDLFDLIKSTTIKAKSMNNGVDKNKMIDRLICGMQKITHFKQQLVNIGIEMNEYINYFETM